ncbi:acyltransferase [Prevotella sp. KH2C16]|uniref:acyltransferase family protein n=1 Tax=Prevotella sp. KH2C16 TaxID=1855325 RepID=UPI0008EA7185|nr:acyltransferase [Prevotella sp. KH2C16]SFG36066.1 Peptidoglycan/LPS O-acetylase OafA/YrhL, contains acyltransferase and SGNH-hydrolase domains [Prevotella sp. KH2C16]
MSKELLTRAECNALRGLAIIGIFLHNYCHWLSPIVKENEYTFTRHNVEVFGQVLSHPDANLPLHLLSFFGHYGVPIFLFLSAFGLVNKYELASSRSVPVVPFVRYHYLKLFKMMIVGFVAFVLVDAITPGSWHYDVVKVVAQLLMLNNLLPDPDHMIWPGPYWFFGLMLQLYVVYRCMLYKRHWGWTAGLMAVCLAVQLCLAPEGEELNRYRYNFMGGMLPFGAGLLYARFGGRLIGRAGLKGCWLFGGFLLFSALVVAMSYDFVAWAVVPLAVCGASICLVKWLTRMPGSISKAVFAVLEWMGGISAALFVCHPITRKILIPISRHGDIYTGLILYIVASICVAWLFKELMKRIPNPKMKLKDEA